MNGTQTSDREIGHSTARPVGVMVALAVLAGSGSYLAAQIDYLRRHHPGIPPVRYLWPQLTQIWLPGAGLCVALSVIALTFHARGRRSRLHTGPHPVPSGRRDG